MHRKILVLVDNRKVTQSAIDQAITLAQTHRADIFFFSCCLTQIVLRWWSRAIAALEAWHGQDAVQGQFETGDSVQQSAHWSAGDVDISVYLSITAEACSTKIAFKKRELKDASSL